jgi:hypothetical protein
MLFVLTLLQRLQSEITQLARQHMDVSQERDDAVAAREAAALELRSAALAFPPRARLPSDYVSAFNIIFRRHKSSVSERSSDLQQQLHSCMRCRCCRRRLVLLGVVHATAFYLPPDDAWCGMQHCLQGVVSALLASVVVISTTPISGTRMRCGRR